MKKQAFKTIGLILLITGNLLFAFLGIISMWGDIEASVFNAAIRSEIPLSALRCPVIITPNDNAAVSARIHNPSDRELEMKIRTYVSDGYVILMKEIFTYFTLGPGETETVYVPIYVEDAAYDTVVLVRMHQLSRGPLPYMNASCGVIVFNIPYFTGTQLLILIISLGLIFCAAGIILLVRDAKLKLINPLETYKFFIFFTGLSSLILITGLLGLWALTLGLTIIWLLLGVGKLGQEALKEKLENEISDRGRE
jgi:hypothetical protein